MTKDELTAKIELAEKALAKTRSWKCRNDLKKYIKRLRKELRKA